MANANGNPGKLNFTSSPLNQLLNQVTTTKLDRSNLLLWKHLALPILRGYKIEGYMLGHIPCPSMYVSRPTVSSTTQSTVETTAEMASSQTMASSSMSTPTEEVVNPGFEAWLVVDQLLLGWMYNSMTLEIATKLMGFEHSKDLWDAIQELFGIQSRAEEDYLRQTFQQTRKGNNSMIEYFSPTKS